ncbi:MAG: hypothetical protein AB1656_11340 [Candidatus Omnitrophota bacterium]
MSSQERFDLSTEILQNASDVAISLEAVKDLVRLGQALKKDDDALKQIEKLLKKTEKDSPLERNALLAKARLLRRLGQKEEGDAIYRQACEEKWDNSFTDYRDSLSETGEDDKRAANIHNGWFAYRNEKDLFYFADALKRYKTKNSSHSVAEKVLPQLADSPGHPQILQLAQALCLTIDAHYGEALTMFDAVENEFQKTIGLLSSTDEFYKENENLPLYRALCLFLEGRDFNAARQNISSYLDKSQSSPRWQAERIMNILWHLEKSKENMPRMLEVTSLVLESSLIKDEKIRVEIPMDLAAGLYDFHQLGLAWNGRFDEAEAWCLKGMEEFFPQTLAGANMAKCYGQALYMKKKYKESEELLKYVLSNYPKEEVVPSIKYCLAEALVAQNKLEEATPLLEDVILRFERSIEHSDMDCKEKSIRLLAHLQQVKKSGGDVRRYRFDELN